MHNASILQVLAHWMRIFCLLYSTEITPGNCLATFIAWDILTESSPICSTRTYKDIGTCQVLAGGFSTFYCDSRGLKFLSVGAFLRDIAGLRLLDSAPHFWSPMPPAALAVTAEGASCAARAVPSEGMQTTWTARCFPADRFPDGVPAPGESPAPRSGQKRSAREVCNDRMSSHPKCERERCY